MKRQAESNERVHWKCQLYYCEKFLLNIDCDNMGPAEEKKNKNVWCS